MFYGATILIVLLNLSLYFSVRGSITDFFRFNKLSKTNIRKNTKGFKNYWFYRELNKIKPLGLMYYANIIYFYLTLFYTALSLSLGYIRVLQPVFFVTSIGICLLQIPMTIWSVYYDNLYAFGKAFVLCSRFPDARRHLRTILDYIWPWAVTGMLICLSYQEML